MSFSLDTLDWLERTGDRLNPILVKETRQALKSRQFIITFLLMLIAAWMISVFGTLTAGDALEFGSAGRGFFILYFYVLALAIFTVVPYTAYRSLLNERDQTTLELLSITTLSPRQLVWGKLCSALVQDFIFYSAIAPFIAFTSLLQGFDLAQVAFVLTASVLISISLTMLALMLAAVPQNRQVQGGTTLMVFGGLVWLVFVVLFGVPEMLSSPIPFDDREFWIGVGCVVVLGLSFLHLFQQVATAHLTFESDNRSTGIRVACTIQFLLWWAAFSAVWWWVAPRGVSMTVDAIAGGSIPCAIYFCVVGFFVATEPDYVSRRVRRGFPNSHLLRLISVPFMPGGQRGFLYLMLHLTALFVIVEALLGISGSTGTSIHFWILSMIFYMVAYIGIGCAFGRWLGRLSAEVRPMHSRVIIIVVLAMGTMVPYLPGAFGLWRYRELFETLKVTNPFAMLSYAAWYGNAWSIRDTDFIVLLIAAGIGFLVNLRPMRQGIAEVLLAPRSPANLEVVSANVPVAEVWSEPVAPNTESTSPEA